MEWRDVPGFPGYQVSERGKLRKKGTRYELGMCGNKYSLRGFGGTKRMTKRELLALAWPSEQDDMPEAEKARPETPLSEKPEAETRIEKGAPFPPEGFAPVPGCEGYFLNRKGELLRPSGVIAKPRQTANKFSFFHFICGRNYSVGRWLVLTFGPGAAAAAGYRERAAILGASQQERPRRGAAKKRRCHDCGKPTDNYRCNACWTKLRGFADCQDSEWEGI